MRILELILAPIEGGAHTLVSDLARRWRAAGHSVDIVALDPAPSEDAEIKSRALFGEEVRVLRPRVTALGRPLLKQATRLMTLRSAMRKGQYDVIHAHCMQPNIYSRLAGLGRASSPPIVVTMHSPDRADYRAWRSRFAEQLLAKRTAAVVAVSEETATDYREMFPAAASKVVVIPNGIPRLIRARTDLPDTPSRFLALSRINPQKDIATMIRGFDRYLGRSGESATLDIAGGFDDAAYGAEILSLHERLAHRDRIRFLGSRTDIPDLLASADAFVHSAEREAHSIAILEAAAAGLPIITTDLRPVRESLGSAATYYPIGSPEGLADALESLRLQWSECVQLAAREAENIASRYSMAACADSHLALLDRVIRAG